MSSFAQLTPIGLSCVRFPTIEANLLTVAGVDILDGTPVLDIKPYVPRFDAFPQSRAGWLETGRGERMLADDRFRSDGSGSRE